MAKKTRFFDRFRLVYRHSSLLLKCIVLATIILSVAALTVLRIGIHQYQERTEMLRAEAAQMEQKNQRLTEHLQDLGTVQSVKRIATEELDLVDPDTIFYEVETNQE